MLFRVTHSVEMPGIPARHFRRYFLDETLSKYSVPTVVITFMLAKTLDVIRRAKIRKK